MTPFRCRSCGGYCATREPVSVSVSIDDRRESVRLCPRCAGEELTTQLARQPATMRAGWWAEHQRGSSHEQGLRRLG